MMSFVLQGGVLQGVVLQVAARARRPTKYGPTKVIMIIALDASVGFDQQNA